MPPVKESQAGRESLVFCKKSPRYTVCSIHTEEGNSLVKCRQYSLVITTEVLR